MKRILFPTFVVSVFVFTAFAFPIVDVLSNLKTEIASTLYAFFDTREFKKTANRDGVKYSADPAAKTNSNSAAGAHDDLFADASRILWSSSSGSAWLTASNWTGGAIPDGTQIAQFAANPVSGTTGVGINMSGSTNNGANNQIVGAIEAASTRGAPLIIGDSNTTVSGTLTLSGVTVNNIDNVILRNASSHLLTLQNIQGSAGSRTMAIALGNATDNVISIDGSGGMTISSAITGSGRNLSLRTSSFNGNNVLNLSGVNTYSGNTTILSGALSLIGSGSISQSPLIEIAGGAYLDVQSLISPLVLSGGQSLRASGSNSSGTIATSGTKGLTTAPNSTIEFTAFNGVTPPLALLGTGTLGLQAGNSVVVTVSNSGVPLSPGSYKLISKGATGTVTGLPGFLTVNGDGVNGIPTLSLVSGELYLNVTAGVPAIQVTGGPMNFGDQAVGATSSTLSVTVTNTGTADLVLGTPTLVTGTQFAVTGTPNGTVVAPAASTTVGFTFTPTSSGSKTDTATIVSNASGTAPTVSLSGNGLTVPDTFLNSTPLPTDDRTMATFSFSSDQPSATFECKLDAEPGFTACTTPKSYSALGDGAHTFSVRAVLSGTPDPSPTTFNWTIDTSAPDTVITEAPASSSTSTMAVFSFTSPDTVADLNRFECSVDGAAFATCGSPFTVYVVNSVVHVFRVRAVNNSNVADPVPASFSWTPNEPADGTFWLAGSTASVQESVGTATFIVFRPDATPAATVDFATSAITAAQGTDCTAGVDFLATSGTLSFAIGELQKSIVIPICNDADLESAETFTLTLSNNSPGTAIGQFGSTVITIVDNDLTTAAPVIIRGRVMSSYGRGLSRAVVTLTDGNGTTRSTVTNSFGFYRFYDVAVGQSYVVGVSAKGQRFASQLINVTDELSGLDLYPEP